MTHDAATPGVTMHSSELRKLGVLSGDTVKVHQGNASASLVAHTDDRMPAETARVAAGHPATAGLGAMFGTITVEAIIGDRA
jgi:NADH-quinone oxidoreductase subunit G